MKDFRELESWRKAHQLALDVYRITDALPKQEAFGLSLQLKRAATAVPTRIAEACGRKGDVEFGAGLQRAAAASTELEYLLLLAKDLGYLPVEGYEGMR